MQCTNVLTRFHVIGENTLGVILINVVIAVLLGKASFAESIGCSYSLARHFAPALSLWALSRFFCL